VSVEVRIPTVLRKHTAGEKAVRGAGSTIREVLGDLDARHAGLAEALVDADGSLQRFINMYLNDEDVRYLEQLDTAVNDGDIISILPAVAGGR
jgi:molybdopterin converting factor small subunit